MRCAAKQVYTMTVDVNQVNIVIFWGTIIVLLYYLLRTLFLKPRPRSPRVEKPVVNLIRRRRSAPADNAPYRRHLVNSLTYHDAAPKVDDYRYGSYPHSTGISWAPHHRPQQVQGFQPDEVNHQHNGSDVPVFSPLPRALDVFSINRLMAHQAPCTGFRSDDFLPPSDLLGLTFARRKQEIVVAKALNRQGQEAYTPLLVACWNCDEAAIESSIKFGADVREKTADGETGLMLCTYRMARGKTTWNPRCLELLFDKGCPIDDVTRDNNTALHLAVKAGHRPATKWLLAHGATVDIANNKGWRPIAIAQAKGRADLVELLWEFDPESEANEEENGSDEEENGSDRSSSYHTANAELK